MGLRTYFLRVRSIEGKDYKDEDHPLQAVTDDEAVSLATIALSTMSLPSHVRAGVVYRLEDGTVGQLLRLR